MDAQTCFDENFEYLQDVPTEEEILNWREANDYIYEGDECFAGEDF